MLNAQNNNINLVLIASDANVSLDTIKAQRDMGFNAYYLQRAGKNPIVNRIKIKKYITKFLNGHKLKAIEKFGFGIPVQLMFDRKGQLLNSNAPWLNNKLINEYLSTKPTSTAKNDVN